MRPGTKEGKKYAQIVSSVRAIGLVEAPVVTPDKKRPGAYFLLDGHLRIEALRDLSVNEVECLVSTDDEAYTYNKRLNRLAAVQEHRMIVRAVERGVPAERIAEALDLDVGTIQRRFRMLNGICAEAVELLKDTTCPLIVFELLRRMAPIRQVEAAELMIGQNNFSSMFAAFINERQLYLAESIAFCDSESISAALRNCDVGSGSRGAFRNSDGQRHGRGFQR